MIIIARKTNQKRGKNKNYIIIQTHVLYMYPLAELNMYLYRVLCINIVYTGVYW